jgi:hypothetical protein
MAKELKLWNGRPYGVLPTAQWKDRHIYVAAYSVEDARRVCREAGLSDPGRYEIQVYWSANCWGNSMAGIPVERGIWISCGRATPVKVKPNVLLTGAVRRPVE